MTNPVVFQYEDLTWPEVAALPRDTPLLIPLGDGFDPGSLPAALGSPERIGLLPAIPYGWRGSGLEVPAEVLAPFLHNLLEGLRDDGFTRVLALAPPAVNLGLGDEIIAYPTTVAGAVVSADTRKVVLIPVGHTEQHGCHTPMNTDSLIIDAIAKRTAAAVPAEATTLPVMPYGVSTHRDSFAGTLNAGGRAFEDFCLAVVDKLVEEGATRMYLMSGHGGNCSFLANVVKYAGERHRRAFIATSWLYLSGPAGITALERARLSPTGGMGHACELETSLILHLRPELVHMERVVDEMGFVTTPSYFMDWIEGGALIANPPWDDDTETGAYGAGSLATAEHGRIWLEAAVAEKVAHVREIDEQHRRREERRRAGYGLWGKR